jgi:hypothetical protein
VIEASTDMAGAGPDWIDINIRPREKGWYAVQCLADDGDGRLDDWRVVDYWDGRRWKSGPASCGKTYYPTPVPKWISSEELDHDQVCSRE